MSIASKKTRMPHSHILAAQIGSHTMKTRLFFILLVIFLCQIRCSTGSSIKKSKMKLISVWSNAGETDTEKIIGDVSDFAVTSERELAILDVDACQLIFTSLDGEMLRRTGRKGRGPGEFIWPGALFSIKDTLVVFDRNMKQFHFFLSDGTFIKSRININLHNNAVWYSSDSRLFNAAGGFRAEDLIHEYDVKMNLARSFGELESRPVQGYDFEVLKSYTRKREVPPSSLNELIVCEGKESTLFAIHTAMPKIKKFSRSGELITEKPYKDDAFDEVTEKFYAVNDTLPPYAWMPLRYWLDCTPDGEGGVYCLLNNADNIIVYHFGQDCELVEVLWDEGTQARRIYYKDNSIWVYLADTIEFRCYNAGQ